MASSIHYLHNRRKGRRVFVGPRESQGCLELRYKNILYIYNIMYIYIHSLYIYIYMVYIYIYSICVYIDMFFVLYTSVFHFWSFGHIVVLNPMRIIF